MMNVINTLLLIFGVFLRVFMVVKFWGWFIVPVFSVPAIGMWQSLGLLMTFEILKGYKYETEQVLPEEQLFRISNLLAQYLLVFGVGYLVSLAL